MKKYNLLIFNIWFFIVIEVLFKKLVFSSVFTFDTLLIILFSICNGIIVTIISSIFKNTTINKIINSILLIIVWVLITAQYVYFEYYNTIFSIYSLFHGAQVFGFTDSIISVMWHNINGVILLTLPLILFFAFIRKIDFNRKKILYYLILIIGIIAVYFSNIGLLNINKEKTYSSYNLYFKTHVPKLAVKSFGVITEMRLDLKRTLFNFKEEILKTESNDVLKENTENIYNVMNIDFDSLIENEDNDLIKSMHKYFKSEEGTNKNEYTGMFEGKNLIVIIAEAFSPMAINKELTPTLYKLYNEGFNFNNFYSPVYYVSTSDGEYISLTSLLPKEGTWSMTKSSNMYLPFVYGNVFKTYGYSANAYHDGEYNYYNRNLSLPNMGYTYKGCYGGLNINCGIWPQSDIEMIEATADEYINNDKFMTYYMTVSGHLQYTYNGNNIATKNKSYVIDLPYSEAIQSYLATQIELDKAVELLIQKLSDAGKLDDTVIAISADHYPYGLTNDEILEYADYVKDEKFDIHKNAFLLWNNEMKESIVIDKYASSLDILPTILNLFNIEYDSRLLIGKDILSYRDGLVIYNDRSWITSYGKYDSITETFTPFNNITDDYSDYIKKINLEVYNKFLMSKLILENDYYKKVLK